MNKCPIIKAVNNDNCKQTFNEVVEACPFMKACVDALDRLNDKHVPSIYRVQDAIKIIDKAVKDK